MSDDTMIVAAHPDDAEAQVGRDSSIKSGGPMGQHVQGTVAWQDGMAFTATAGSGHSIPLDASVEDGGQDHGSRPMELLLLGLGGCTGMDVITILRKKRQDVTGYEVRVSGERASSYPMVFTRIAVEHVVRGYNLSEEAVRRAVELSATRYCSAAAMLGKVARIEESYRVVEDAPESSTQGVAHEPVQKAR
jgi:putative redox protein